MFGECGVQRLEEFLYKACKKNLSFICHNAYSDYSNSSFSYIGGMYDPKSFTNVAHNVIMHLLFIHNFDSHTIGTTISTAWTMSIEVQFYVLFPLICIPFRKNLFLQQSLCL